VSPSSRSTFATPLPARASPCPRRREIAPRAFR
jgi:hypothetical protein